MNKQHIILMAVLFVVLAIIAEYVAIQIYVKTTAGKDILSNLLSSITGTTP